MNAGASTRARLLAGATLLTVSAMPADAQAGTTASATNAGQSIAPAATPAAQQTLSGRLEEVIVTARRRTESVRTFPSRFRRLARSKSSSAA